MGSVIPAWCTCTRIVFLVKFLPELLFGTSSCVVRLLAHSSTGTERNRPLPALCAWVLTEHGKMLEVREMGRSSPPSAPELHLSSARAEPELCLSYAYALMTLMLVWLYGLSSVLPYQAGFAWWSLLFTDPGHCGWTCSAFSLGTLKPRTSEGEHWPEVWKENFRQPLKESLLCGTGSSPAVYKQEGLFKQRSE